AAPSANAATASLRVDFFDPAAESSPMSDAGSLLAIGGLERPHKEGQLRRESGPLNVFRARALLRSMTVPGWGEATIGHRRSAALFGIAETGIWATFAAFHVQVKMRRETYVRTASLFAGIDLHARDEESRRIAGAVLTS